MIGTGVVTVDLALRAARRRLRGGAQPGSSRDAQWLLSAILCREPGWLVAHGDAALSPADLAAFEASVERRALGEPVAYILGTAGFYGAEYVVSPAVLVPRPESEHVVEAAIADLRSRLARAPAVRLCDVGTGSGALAIACALAVPAAGIVGTDASAAALAIAARNAERLGVAARSRFLEGDLFAPAARFGPYDVVVANLPYIPTRDVPAKPDPVGFEPPLALDGGADGLELYRRLLEQLAAAAGSGAIATRASSERRATSCHFEAAPGTIEPLAALAENVFPEAYVEIGEDYAGLERFVSVTL